ncbi:hypothetical protein AYM37_15365 (plasmid) [Staphylococcus aureus]|nr:hypothetical protein AYM28_15365 [Staphylococcus aureus]AQR53192.1 hypothetical protein AYM37_15365 [Staphylococcus aureus]
MEYLKFLNSISNTLYLPAQIMIGISLFGYLLSVMLRSQCRYKIKRMLYIRNLSVHVLFISLLIALINFVDIHFYDLFLSMCLMIVLSVITIPANIYLTSLFKTNNKFFQ